MTNTMQQLQRITDSGMEVTPEVMTKPNYRYETEPMEWITDADVQDHYKFISELHKGRFSGVVKGIDKRTDDVVVAKLLDTKINNEVAIEHEFKVLSTLRHERIAGLLTAYKKSDSLTAALILEKLQGADIFTFLSSKKEYTEQMVATIVMQVLDGLQYLHWRGYCHLDLQPDNIVMCSLRSVQIKLVDFGSAQKVSKLGNKVNKCGHPDYTAPEILEDGDAFPQTDIWSLGVLTYIMLSGVHPFRGSDAAETRQNIIFVRYRFEHLFKEVTQEAIRFLMLLFKRSPVKRPTSEESIEHRWFQTTDFMIKKRERAIFPGTKLKAFSDEYHAEKQSGPTAEISTNGGRKIIRSESFIEELSVMS